MKRWISVCLVLVIILGLCMPMSSASGIVEMKYDPATNLILMGNGDMVWEDHNKGESDFLGYHVKIRYVEAAVGAPVPGADTKWTEEYYYQTVTAANLGDYGLPVDGYYSFSVQAYGNGYKSDGSFYEYYSNWSEWSEPVYFVRPTTALAAPTGLRWDGCTLSWNVDTSDSVERYALQIFTKGTNGNESILVDVSYIYAPYGKNTISYRLGDDYLGEEYLRSLGDQDYYFKVKAISGDRLNLLDSDWSTSGAMHISANAPSLSAPANLAWDGNTMTWDKVNGIAYTVELYVERELTQEEKDELGAGGGLSEELTAPRKVKTYSNVTEFPTLDNSVLTDGSGKYFFRVRAISNDLSTAFSSDWSADSPKKQVDGYFCLNAPENLAIDNDGVLSWSWSCPEDQKEYVSKFTVSVYYRADQEETTTPVLLDTFNVKANVFSTDAWRQYVESDGYYSFTVKVISNDTNELKNSDESARSAEIYYELPDALPAPTNLRWEGSSAVWTPVSGAAAALVDGYEVIVWRGEGDAKRQVLQAEAASDEDRFVCTSDFLTKEDCYTFTVRTISSDLLAAANSAVVDCTVPLQYTKPTAYMPAPTGLHWDKKFAKWDIPSDGPAVAYYEFEWVGSDKTTDFTVYPGEGFPSVYNKLLTSHGENLLFRVRAISGDATAYLDSDWATVSTAYEWPDALPAPTNLSWNGDTMTWFWDGDKDLLQSFVVNLYFAETADEEPEPVIGLGTKVTELAKNIWGRHAEESGLYYFTVEARSINEDEAADSPESEMSAAFVFTAPERLAAPSNLRWDGMKAVWTASADAEKETIDEYEICLEYYNPGKEKWVECNYFYADPDESEYSFLAEDFNRGDGTYRFSMCAVTGDVDAASNSEFVYSAGAVYRDPGKTLPTVEGLAWEGRTMVWSKITDENLSHYEVMMFGVETSKSSSFTVLPDEKFPTLRDSHINRLGSQVYFQVRAISKDILVVSESDWSDESEIHDVNAVQQLNTPSNLRYDAAAGVVSWDAVENATQYRVAVSYSADADGEKTELEEKLVSGTAYALQAIEGLGVYSVKVSAEDSTANYQNSAWSQPCVAAVAQGRKLAAPTVLTWGTFRDVDFDEFLRERTLPGTIAWNRGFDQGCYRICLYRDGETAPVAEYEFEDWYSLPGETYMDDRFVRTGLESGTYHFTIQTLALADSVFTDSDVVRSADWVYTAPVEKLLPMQDPAWEGNRMTWKLSEPEARYYGYGILVYYAETANGIPSKIGSYTYCGSVDTWMELPDRYGDGYYWFEVCGISADITQYLHSEYTERCGPYNRNQAAENLREVLEELLDSDCSAQEAAAVIKNQIGTEALASAMATGDETLDLLQELEEKLTVTCTVDSTLASIAAKEIAMVGAALNAGENSDVTLKIGAANAMAAIPDGYADAVTFSMHLEGGADTDPDTEGQQLAVPMQITLPIPAGVHPACMVILHEVNGQTEEIRPVVFEENGKWYASFVVTSFSNFAAATVELQAEKTAGGVKVTAAFSLAPAGTVICAVYDGSERLLGTAFMEKPAVGSNDVTVVCDGIMQAASVKLFLLEGNSMPAFRALACETIQS